MMEFFLFGGVRISHVNLPADIKMTKSIQRVLAYLLLHCDRPHSRSMLYGVFWGGMGLLEIVTPAGASYCYHFDGTGNTIALTDSTQAVANKYAYDPFGAVASQSETVAQPFKFVGQFGVMAETNGFYYMGARYYDPAVGRFISEDPTGFGGGDFNLYAYYDAAQGRFITPDTIVQSPGNPQTLNRYAYAGNNPLTFVDPTGHGFLSFLEDFFAALFGAAITVLSAGSLGPVVAGMLGGMVAGGTGAAMHGAGLIGIVKGAFMGALGGAIAGGIYMAGVPWQVMAGAGAAIAGGTGGVKGLESFAAASPVRLPAACSAVI